MKAWEIWEEEFGSTISYMHGSTLEWVTGFNDMGEVKEYVKEKYKPPRWIPDLISIREIEITVVTKLGFSDSVNEKVNKVE